MNPPTQQQIILLREAWISRKQALIHNNIEKEVAEQVHGLFPRINAVHAVEIFRYQIELAYLHNIINIMGFNLKIDGESCIVNGVDING